MVCFTWPKIFESNDTAFVKQRLVIRSSVHSTPEEFVEKRGFHSENA